MAMRLLLEMSKVNPEIKGNIPSQFLARLGTIFGYLKNKSAEEYYLTGATEFLVLMESGAIAKQDSGQYVVRDIEKGVTVLAELGDRIIKEFYVNEESSPKEVKAYVKELNQQSKDLRIIELLNDLK
jgi:hypothetical protein